MKPQSETVEFYSQFIGQQVSKTRGKRESKKFKSGSKFNTVTGVINHPILNVPAFTFAEDDSFVECRRCFLHQERGETSTTSLTHKKGCLDKAQNNEDRQRMIYDWCVNGQLLKQELWELIGFCKMGISKKQLQLQYTGPDDPESVMG
jgi:hypothetical protein